MLAHDYPGQARADDLQQLQSAAAPHCSRGFSRQEKQQACTLQDTTVRSNSTKPLQQKENTHRRYA